MAGNIVADFGDRRGQGLVEGEVRTLPAILIGTAKKDDIDIVEGFIGDRLDRRADPQG
jgi:hypothetical protein